MLFVSAIKERLQQSQDCCRPRELWSEYLTANYRYYIFKHMLAFSLPAQKDDEWNIYLAFVVDAY